MPDLLRRAEGSIDRPTRVSPLSTLAAARARGCLGGTVPAAAERPVGGALAAARGAHDLGRLAFREGDRGGARQLERGLDHDRGGEGVVGDDAPLTAQAQSAGEAHRLARGQHVDRPFDDEPEGHRFLQGGRYYAGVSTPSNSSALWAIPASVTYAVTSSCGVTSKARFSTWTPAGARRRPPRVVTSPASRRSIGIAAPSGHSRSSVESGAAT